MPSSTRFPVIPSESEIFTENLLVRIYLIIEMMRWTSLAPWNFELRFSGRLISTFLAKGRYPDTPSYSITPKS